MSCVMCLIWLHNHVVMKDTFQWCEVSTFKWLILFNLTNINKYFHFDKNKLSNQIGCWTRHMANMMLTWCKHKLSNLSNVIEFSHPHIDAISWLYNVSFWWCVNIKIEKMLYAYLKIWITKKIEDVKKLSCF
jgi:hypothetical protein